MKSKPQAYTINLARITILLLLSGIISLISSIYYDSQIIALIGLGLTFWGALFLFLRPGKQVDASLLYSAAIPAYLTIDRIIKELTEEGKAHYIPPYPKDVYLPEYLKGLKEAVVFVSTEKNSKMPPIEEIAKGEFISKKSNGVLLSPPGLGLLTHIEEQFKIDFTKMELNDLCIVLPRIILQDLNLAKNIEMEPKKDQIRLRILDSVYKNLYSVQNNLKSVDLLGCPIISACACALAKTSGKTVTIQKQRASSDYMTIEAWYEITQG